VYRPSHLLAGGVTAYLGVSLLRALCKVSNSPCLTSLGSLQALGHLEPSLLLPLLVLVCNWRVLAAPEHPFLLNLRHRWPPSSLLLLALYSGGLALVLPQSYLWLHLGFVAAHLGVRAGAKWRGAVLGQRQRAFVHNQFLTQTKYKAL